ncbi:MAG: AAA family ATPase [Xanthomonadales bacterium]|nr:AAA family ATPase [Xanthomonadales bacterium]
MNASLAAEQALIGALMLGSGGVDRVIGELDVDQLEVPAHGEVLRSIYALHAEGHTTDAVTVAEHLEHRQKLASAGGLSYLVDLCNNAPGVGSIASHLKVVQKAHRRQSARKIGERLVAAAMNDDGAPQHAALALARLDEGPSSGDEVSMPHAARCAYQAIELAYQHRGELQGVTSGISQLDQVIGGWQGGDLVVVQARPAMGKTALLLAFADAAAGKGIPVGIVSAEQPTLQLTQRLLSMRSRIPLWVMRSGDLTDTDWRVVAEATGFIRALPIHFLDMSSPTIERVARQCRRWARMGAKVAFVDYLQRLSADAESRREEVSRIARGLKTAARDSGMCVVALAQSVRDVDTRLKNKRPGLGDIAESSDCEREADIVISLYRDDAARPDATDVRRGEAELIVVKNRHGPTGTISVDFDAECVRFSDRCHRT